MTSLALPPTVALVDETKSIPPEELTAVAGALGEQVAVDFEPVWKVRANVIATQNPGVFQWEVRIKEQLSEPGALGYHLDRNHVPYAEVDLTENWALTVSHEVLEMLADPWGSRTHGARVPQGINYRDVGLPRESTHVHYLVEVCDPCEATSYPVQDVELSDFLRPSYYRTHPTQVAAYSHAGGVSKPREVAPGGYVSFARNDGVWFQVFGRSGRPVLRELGRFDRQAFASLREFSDHHARKDRP